MFDHQVSDHTNDHDTDDDHSFSVTNRTSTRKTSTLLIVFFHEFHGHRGGFFLMEILLFQRGQQSLVLYPGLIIQNASFHVGQNIPLRDPFGPQRLK
jgi:hypothetical protein